MAVKNTPEERKIITLVNAMHVDEKLKQEWSETIRANGLTEELVDTIHKSLTSGEDETTKAMQLRQLADFSRLIKQWRFATQSRNFRQRA